MRLQLIVRHGRPAAVFPVRPNAVDNRSRVGERRAAIGWNPHSCITQIPVEAAVRDPLENQG